MDKLLIVSSITTAAALIAMLLASYSAVVTIGRIHLMRTQEGSVLVTDDGPALHQPVPSAQVLSLTGETIALFTVSDRPTALIFLDPKCSACASLGKAMGTCARERSLKADIIAVVEAEEASVRIFARRHRISQSCVSDTSGVLRRELGIARVPFGLYIDSRGIVRMKGVVNNGLQLEGLLRLRGRDFAGYKWQTNESQS